MNDMSHAPGVEFAFDFAGFMTRHPLPALHGVRTSCTGQYSINNMQSAHKSSFCGMSLPPVEQSPFSIKSNALAKPWILCEVCAVHFVGVHAVFPYVMGITTCLPPSVPGFVPDFVPLAMVFQFSGTDAGGDRRRRIESEDHVVLHVQYLRTPYDPDGEGLER